jgi:hypothetical protein
MRPLFAYWSEVAARLASSPKIALFLDFDGTLVSIQPRPELVRMHPDARRTLAALVRNPRFRVWVGGHGHEHVRENFLVTGNLRRYLRLFLHHAKPV